MSEQETTERGSAASPTSTTLSEAREKLGLSQKEVADKLFLTTTFIRYIDDGDFGKLPKPAFVKGYLRTYARVVGLSGDDIVELYEKEVESSEPAPEIRGVTEEQVGTASITGPVLQTGLFGLACLIFVIGIVWFLVSGDDESENSPVVTQSSLSGPVVAESSSRELGPNKDAAAEPMPAPSAVPILEADQQRSSQQTSPESENLTSPAKTIVPEALESQSEQSAESFNEAADAPSRTESGVTIERAFEGERRYVTVSAGGTDQVELSFSDECWVEISDADLGLIYNDLNRPADVLTVIGTAPFDLLLGKATGVEMLYNGRPFDLGPYISPDSTAKLTISE